MEDKRIDSEEEVKTPSKPPRLDKIPSPEGSNGMTNPINGINSTTTVNSINSTTSINSSSNLPKVSSGSKLDKNILSNLNKSLKAKQKIITSKEPLPKNSTIISEIINRSPTSTSFTIQPPPSSTNASHNELDNIPNLQLSEEKKKLKKVSKQNSTRTDFFAAKLASAVDDVDSSDSDETFVYENNINDYEEGTEDRPIPAINDQETTNETTENLSKVSTIEDNDKDHNDTNVNDNDTEEPEDNDEANTTITGEIIAEDKLPDRIDKFDKPEKPEKLEKINTPPKINLDMKPDKLNLKNPFPINSSKPINNTTVNNSNQFLDGLINKNLRPNNQRTLSTHSFEGNVQQSPNSPTHLQNLVIASQSHSSSSNLLKEKPSTSPYSSHYSSHNSSFKPSNISDSEYNSTDDDYRKDDVTSDDNLDKSDDEIEGSDGEVVDVDDVLSHDSYNSTKHTSNSTMPQRKPKNLLLSDKNIDSTNSITSKSTKKKSVTSSSKLRSTTSKLFDKKGSQPRRYSIIPDDVDIEDFDDELIYYDNNIRFPYNSSINGATQPPPTHQNSYNYNENSPLMNQPRIHHYRSLNLNPQKRLNKNKRYLSTGGQTMNSPSNNMNSDIFPFPYPEQSNQSQYYYGFDEYDEETGSINEHQFDKISRKGSTRFHGTPNNLSNQNNFFLPRKRSFVIDSNFKQYNYNYIKRTIYTLISIFGILTIGFIMGFVIATTKDLSNLNIIDIQNTIVSEDELIFNTIIQALNPGWFTIGIEEVELDIFAKSGYLPDLDRGDYNYEENSVETVLLGSIYRLESPIYFQGGFFNRNLISQIAEIKLVSPGKNLTSIDNTTKPDNSEKWQTILKNPFDLIIRGILKYNLPLTKNTKSVVVTKTSYIDPNTLSFKEVV